ncbi:MAG: ATP-dependent helicase [Actinomycetales bacterium]|nr:ATP-dependent helicase [Actinomycetales bacterium]
MRSSSDAIGSADELLYGLDDEQRRAAQALLGPVAILAGAGTGKTRAITHRIAYGVATGAYDPERVLALTFTARAAGELRVRLRGLGAGGVAARTFHAAALAQLGYFWPRLTGSPAPALLGAKASLLGQAAESLRLRAGPGTLRDVAGEIEWRKVSRLSLEEYAERAAARPVEGLSVDQSLELQRRYEQLKDERKRLDFEDVLLVTAGMIAAEPAVAEEVRSRYRIFTVDEYQDVSALQQELLELWLGPRTDLCVVGDASQTIFSFAGATDAYLLGFATRYPEAEVIRLERNYRSTGGVLTLANSLMRGRAGALELYAAEGPASGRRPAAPIAYNDDAAEARGVAASIATQISQGTPPAQIAVLARVAAQTVAIEQALAELGIGARQLGGARFFELEAVTRAMLELRSLARETPTARLYDTVADVARRAGWTLEPPPAGGSRRERWEALTALVELADAAAEGMTLPEFVAELADREAAQHEPPLHAVTLSTLHGAKGLEWDSVHLIGLAEGVLPIGYARTPAEIDEERRLLYVGLTRARRRLSLSWARAGLRGRPRDPSRFLTELSTGSRDAGASGAR